MSASLVSLLERGHAAALAVRSLPRIASMLDLRLGWDVGFRAAELASLRDTGHARLAEWLMRRLEDLGWTVFPEVSFNHFGDRGRVDLLAFHSPTKSLLVIEIKTVIMDVQSLLGSLDVKERVAPNIARSLGWSATRPIPCLAVSETTTNRRRLAAHERLFARFSLRGKGAVTWLRRPDDSPRGLLLLMKLPDDNRVGRRRADRQRVRPARPPMSVDSPRDRSAGPSHPA